MKRKGYDYYECTKKRDRLFKKTISLKIYNNASYSWPSFITCHNLSFSSWSPVFVIEEINTIG